MECWRTLFDTKKSVKGPKKGWVGLRWPSFGGLHGKQSQHGRGHVVVMELLLLPQPREHWRWLSRLENEVFTPVIGFSIRHLTQFEFWPRLTGTCPPFVCFRPCSRRISRWTIGPQWRQKWTIGENDRIYSSKRCLFLKYLEEEVDNEDVEHIFQGVDDAVKNGL